MQICMLMYLKFMFPEKNIRKEELAKSEKQKGYICLSRVEVRQVQRSSSVRPEGGARTVFFAFFLPALAVEQDFRIMTRCSAVKVREK